MDFVMKSLSNFIHSVAKVFCSAIS